MTDAIIRDVGEAVTIRPLCEGVLNWLWATPEPMPVPIGGVYLVPIQQGYDIADRLERAGYNVSFEE